MDFNNLLDNRVGEVEAPKRLPVGTYTWKITARKFDKSSQKKTDFVQFTYECVGYGEDIEDVSELPENWQGKTITEDWYITADALKRLEEHLKTAGVEEGLSLRDGIELAADGSHYVKGHISHRPYTRRDNTPGIAVEVDVWSAAD
jgi:hypothetical protein